jgi:hypothetical protein
MSPDPQPREQATLGLIPNGPDAPPNDVISISESSKISVISTPKAKMIKKEAVAKVAKPSGQKKAPTPPPKKKQDEEKKEPKPPQKKVQMDDSVIKQKESNRIGKYQQH